MPASRNPNLAGIAAPSVVGRALLVVLLMVGFFLLTLGVGVTLLVIPVAAFWAAKSNLRDVRMWLFFLACCWVPGFLLITSVFTVRRPKFVPSGRRLEERDAPELFTIVRELAQLAGTAAPGEIFLTDDVNLSVSEKGRGERVLSIGAPLLATVTVDEVRAGLAHEFGHFAFGDTRLIGIVSHAHAAFHAVLEQTTTRSAFADTGIGALEAGFAVARRIGTTLVEGYAKFFFWLLRKSDRRAELAADQLAARLVGVEPSIRLLEKVAVTAPLYAFYLQQEIAFTLAAGAMPSDVLAGFEVFSKRCLERGITAEIQEASRKEETDRYDTHPALRDRIAAFHRSTSAAVQIDPRPGTSLVGIALEPWLADTILDAASSMPILRGRVVERLVWSDVPRLAYAPHTLKGAREQAAKLFSMLPQATTLPLMFQQVVIACGSGRSDQLVHVSVPAIASAPPHLRSAIAMDVLGAILGSLFAGALLERGAEIMPSLGESSLVFRFERATVMPFELGAKAMKEASARADAERWAERLVAPSVPFVHAAPIAPAAVMGA